MLQPLAENDVVVEAPCPGMFVSADLAPEDYVEEGQLLGHIIRDDNLELVEIYAPAAGYLWKYGRHDMMCDVRLPDQHPYADEGDMLALIVRT